MLQYLQGETKMNMMKGSDYVKWVKNVDGKVTYLLHFKTDLQKCCKQSNVLFVNVLE